MGKTSATPPEPLHHVPIDQCCRLTRCFVANVTLECYNKGSNLQGFNPGVYYPDYQVRPVPCVEYGLTGS